jgi:hypothetical protein
VAEFTGDSWPEPLLRDRVEAFLAAETAVIHRVKPVKNKDRRSRQRVAGTKQREINLREIVTHLAVEGPGRVAFSLRADPSGSARPAEVLAAIFGEGGIPPTGVRLLKEGVSLAKTERSGPTGQPRAPRYLDA